MDDCRQKKSTGERMKVEYRKPWEAGVAECIEIRGGKAKKKENIRVKRGKKQKEVTVPRDAENDY